MRWIASWFQTPEALCFSSGDYLSPSETAREKFSLPSSEKTFYHYLYERRFVSDGYHKIIFYDCDFTKLELKEIVTLVSVLGNTVIFIDAIFTTQQINFLINENYDLSGCDYTTEPILLEHYIALYEREALSKSRSQWHGVCADFSDHDIREINCDIIAFCDNSLMHNTSMTQEQFNIVLLKRDEKIARRHANPHVSFYNKNHIAPLNLTEISLEGLDISELLNDDHRGRLSKTDPLNEAESESISNEHRIIYFDHMNETGICLAGTCINNAIIHIDCFGFLAISKKFHHWFNREAGLIFTLRSDDGLLTLDYLVDVDIFLEKLAHIHKTPSTARGATRQFPIHCDVMGELKIALLELNNEFREINLQGLSGGLKFLWVAYFAQHRPESRIASVFWKTLKTTQPNRAETPCPLEL